jgi:hypothetical protein
MIITQMNMPEIESEYKNNKLWIRNYSISILLHLVIVLMLTYFFRLQSDSARINSNFFTIDTKEYIQQKPDEVISDLEKNESEKNSIPTEQSVEKLDEIKSLNFSDIIADTTNLDQIYTEPTLSISIKYPRGWTFVDQNKKKKLDGVTFWANDGRYNPPPYIHLEVVDKDMFIEKRYTYKVDLEKSQVFYSDPEEMQGYITQIFYIRTKEDEDFRLKLMIKGEIEFKSFLPSFWAILKSFDFGDSLF